MAFWAPDAEYIAEDRERDSGKQDIADLFKEVRPRSRGRRRPSGAIVPGLCARTWPWRTGRWSSDRARRAQDVNPYAAVWTKTAGGGSSPRPRPAGDHDRRPVRGLPEPALAGVAGRRVGGRLGQGRRAPEVRWGPNKSFLSCITRSGGRRRTRSPWSSGSGGTRRLARPVVGVRLDRRVRRGALAEGREAVGCRLHRRPAGRRDRWGDQHLRVR